jgi:hypothetical protein
MLEVTLTLSAVVVLQHKYYGPLSIIQVFRFLKPSLQFLWRLHLGLFSQPFLGPFGVMLSVASFGED